MSREKADPPIQSNQRILTLADAAAELNIVRKHPALWLKRYLLRCEKRTGQHLLIRSGEGKERARYAVNMETLRTYCPDLMSRAPDIRAAMEQALRKLFRKIESVEERILEVESRQNQIAIRLASGNRK